MKRSAPERIALVYRSAADNKSFYFGEIAFTSSRVQVIRPGTRVQRARPAELAVRNAFLKRSVDLGYATAPAVNSTF